MKTLIVIAALMLPQFNDVMQRQSSIRGYVIEEGTQKLLPGVKVQVATGASDETTNSGRFFIILPPSIKPGDSLVLITARRNYRTGQLRINVPSNPESDPIRISMRPVSAGSRQSAKPKIAIDPRKMVAALKANPEVVRAALDNFGGPEGDRNLKDDEIFAYLDTISWHAVMLANIWEDVLKDLAQAQLEDDESRYRRLLEKYNLHPPNVPWFSSLVEFYKLLPETVNGRLSAEWTRRLTSTLEGLIRHRSTTRRIIEDLGKQSEGSEGFINKRSSTQDLKELSRTIELLYGEAAALDVLAKAVRLVKPTRRIPATPSNRRLN
jgi:hypothetical protein